MFNVFKSIGLVKYLALDEVNPRSFFFFMLFGTLIAVIFHITLSLFHLGYPWTTFLFQPGDRFNDWHNSIRHSFAPNPYQTDGALATYFPFTYVLLKIGTFQEKSLSLMVFFGVAIGLIFISAHQILKKVGQAELSILSGTNNWIYLVLGTLISYPVIFALDRGNIDIWIAFFCVIFVINIDTKYRILGCIFLTVAISLKGYPAAFLLIYFHNKQFGLLMTSLVGVILLTFFPLIFLWGGPSINIFEFQRNFYEFKALYVLDKHSLFASSDPYNAIRMSFLVAQEKALKYMLLPPSWTKLSLREFSTILYNSYIYISFTLASVLSIFVIFANIEQWRRVLAISLICILFPTVANDYKLNLLFPSIYLLVTQKNSSKDNRDIFILLCILLIPKSYFFIKGMSVSMLINPILLVILVIKTLYQPMTWSEIYKKITRIISK